MLGKEESTKSLAARVPPSSTTYLLCTLRKKVYWRALPTTRKHCHLHLMSPPCTEPIHAHRAEVFSPSPVLLQGVKILSTDPWCFYFSLSLSLRDGVHFLSPLISFSLIHYIVIKTKLKFIFSMVLSLYSFLTTLQGHPICSERKSLPIFSFTGFLSSLETS